ncbi:nitrilase-related carbon-nitrogen hydrolase [Duganella sp. BuS-21]|uniref:nitrilase-related carbon-nitrogen hydrolase n=1 Tax=Duganella sp. BuS-21 TaxID=2943848 RepID=UPI0035A5B944
MGIRIAAAQAASVAGDLSANIATHLRFIAAAHAEGVQLLLFPELSLCGYELPLLRACALSADDERLAPLRVAAMAANMTMMMGAPVIDDGAALPCIASISFAADGGISIYRKQHLHGAENQHALPGPAGACVRVLQGRRYAEAICADTTHAEHAGAAAQAGASLYIAGVLISEGGYDNDAALLGGYAEQHNMGVLMANHAAPSGSYATAGKSAFWAPGGALMAQAPGPGDYLVIAEESDGWQGRVIPLSD